MIALEKRGQFPTENYFHSLFPFFAGKKYKHFPMHYWHERI